MKRTTGLLLSVTLLVTAFAMAPARAQLTCSDIELTGPITQRFPRAMDACLDVVQRDGRDYAKFAAQIQRVSGNTVYAKFRLPDGELTDTYAFEMPADARVSVQGRKYRYRDLGPRSDINVYLPPDRWEVHVPDDEDFSTAAAVAVTTPVLAADDDADNMVASLPSTASPLPLIGMLGGVFTSLGLALFAIRRRLFGSAK